MSYVRIVVTRLVVSQLHVPPVVLGGHAHTSRGHIPTSGMYIPTSGMCVPTYGVSHVLTTLPSRGSKRSQ